VSDFGAWAFPWRVVQGEGSSGILIVGFNGCLDGGARSATLSTQRRREELVGKVIQGGGVFTRMGEVEGSFL
jgi:hypothetical protein